ncbi:MAG: 2-C-methyl-D-erythritol 2,4-cyclodiphosphate synthase [Acutalibacteraceae bacterium]|nr:2-C-methyl-D-erythritol 2,4-cyclodiphosphate synthase [Acutalibacteraceae bacterium]
MRIGHGYDVHRFCDDRPLYLGGINIPFEKGLLGHSDADVLLHAISDALLGAAALGDIGHLFPDNDNKYKNIDSKILLKKVAEVIAENGYKICNIDATVIAQKPKLAPYIQDMRNTVANVLDTDVNNVSIKATTEEGLGFTGEMLGISAHCVCIID